MNERIYRVSGKYVTASLFTSREAAEAYAAAKSHYLDGRDVPEVETLTLFEFLKEMSEELEHLTGRLDNLRVC